MKCNKNILLVAESVQKIHLLFYESVIRSCPNEASPFQRVLSGGEHEILLFIEKMRNTVLNYSESLLIFVLPHVAQRLALNE